MEKRKGPQMLTEYLVNNLGDGIINITAPPMRFQQYLVLGEEKALLIDTGFGLGSLKAVVDKLTDLPIILVNTHGHPDHGGGNAEFGAPLLHPDDNGVYDYKCAYETRLEEASHWGVADAAEKLQPTPPKPIAIADGHVFDLGGRTLRVIHTPGHTRGSICILDERTGTLFSGDNTQGGMTNLCEPTATSLEVYLNSMKKIANLPLKRLCTGHMPAVVGPEVIGIKIACAERIMAGEKGEFISSPRGSGWVVAVDGCGIQYDPERIR